MHKFNEGNYLSTEICPNYENYNTNLEHTGAYNCQTKINHGQEFSGIEQRIFKIGNKHYFFVTSGGIPYCYRTSALGSISAGSISDSGSRTSSYLTHPIFGYLESSSKRQGTCYYSCDHQIIQYKGKNLILSLGLVRISQISKANISTDSKNKWNNALYAPWNKEHIALVLSSWYEDGSIDISPNNVIEVFPVTAASSGEATSSTTLYKNTFKFAVYQKNNDNYIVYAYCYPGNSNGNGTHLILGVCRFHFNDQGYVLLHTKREFKQKSTDPTKPYLYSSFGPLTSCSRICFLDIRADHLWIIFANASNKNFMYFYAKADDVIKYAP